MKSWPTDPMRQNDRVIAAFCADLWDMCLNGGSGTPRADRVCEINRQTRLELGTPSRPCHADREDGGSESSHHFPARDRARANNAPRSE